VNAPFIYHMKPLDMRGDFLMPLNSLAKEHPDLFNSGIQKYLGREALIKEKIFPLGCLWNDVLHFAPIHPAIIFRTLEQLGANPKKSILWFKIPIGKIALTPTVYFESDPSDESGAYYFTEKNYSLFLPDKYKEELAIPNKAIDYYRRQVHLNKKILLFNGIKHILVKGRVDISDVEIISWGD